MNHKTKTYAWQGIDRSGTHVSGHSSGQNSALVKALLRGNGIRPTQVNAAGRITLQWPASLGAKDITRFSRQLATLFKAGVPLLQGLGMIAEGINNPPLRSLLGTLKNDIAAGCGLADALRCAGTHASSTSCIATWWPWVSKPAAWTACSTSWQHCRRNARRCGPG